MSAEVLRRAAALMRERAEAVDQPDDEWWNVDSFAEVTNYEDAEHFVAFGRPAVALLVADWLDMVADYMDLALDGRHPGWRGTKHHAFMLATAYLGDPS